MGCTEAKPSKHRPTLLAVPRTTLDDGSRDDDAWALPSPAGCTGKLDKQGWFLFRFVRRVKKEAFHHFTERVFQGQLQDPHLAAFRAKAKLPAP